MTSLLGTHHAPMITTPDTTDHIHHGYGFEVSATGASPTLSAETYVFIGEVGDLTIHFHGFEVSVSEGPVTIQLIEAPTITAAGGDTVTPVNKNRNLAATQLSTLTTSGGATISGGTVLATRMIHTVAGGSHTEAGTAGVLGEWNLKPNTIYAFVLDLPTNISWSTTMFWYELPYDQGVV